MPELQYVTLGLAGLAAVAAIAVPIVLYVALTRRMREVMGRPAQAAQPPAAGKLAEVRDFYAEMSGELRKMLEEANREGNKPRQVQLRRLSDRLDTLKARTLDRPVPQAGRPGMPQQGGFDGRRRRRRRGGGFQRPGGPQGQPRQGGPYPQGGPQPPRPDNRPPQPPPEGQP